MEIIATKIAHGIALNAGKPALEWQKAAPISFCSDWQGENPDPQRETQVRALWSAEMLYLRFECRYRKLCVFDDSEATGRRDELWNRDVAEAFLQPDPSRPRFYREFEVGPNGMWIDLDIFPGGHSDLRSGLRRSVVIDEGAHTWTAELAIPMRAIIEPFDPAHVWRANFYRVEGESEPRAYMAWRPTNTPQPNFHVPEAFGWMRFAR